MLMFFMYTCSGSVPRVFIVSNMHPIHSSVSRDLFQGIQGNVLLHDPEMSDHAVARNNIIHNSRKVVSKYFMKMLLK